MKTVIVDTPCDTFYIDVGDNITDKNLHQYLDKNSKKLLGVDHELIVGTKLMRPIDRERLSILSYLEGSLGELHALIYDNQDENIDREIRFRLRGQNYKLTLVKTRDKE